MSYIFGGQPGRQDPELAKGARRRRQAFARDIGDERGLAFAHELPRRRRRWSGIVGLVLLLFAGLGAIPLLRGSGGGLVSTQCDTPAVAASAGVVSPGGRAAWQVAGPDGRDYVVALDSDGVRVDRAGAVTAVGGQILAGPFRLTGCRSEQTLFVAPAVRGPHLVALYQLTDGAYRSVAADQVKVG